MTRGHTLLIDHQGRMASPPAMVGDPLSLHLPAQVTAVGTRKAATGARAKSGTGQELETIEHRVEDSVSARSAASL